MQKRSPTPALKRPAIGIDLGTTKSCVALFRDSKVEIIRDDQGARVVPSCVAFTKTGRMMGEEAKSRAALNAPNTVFSTKRLIGRSSKDPAVQAEVAFWPFQVVRANEKPRVQVSYQGKEKAFFPEEISAMVLGHLKEMAEAYVGHPVTHAVITVPAHFNDSQRQATKDAATIAGLNTVRILNETTAAALAYGLDNPSSKERNGLIFDLGGGSFSISVFTMDGGIIEVRATAGDTCLGGDDFDNCLVSFFIEEFFKKHQENISQDRRAVWRLRMACETAKRLLSSNGKASVRLDDLYKGIDFHADITRAQFEELCAGLFQRTLELVDRVLQDAGLSQAQIHDVILVGASTRIPKIQELLQDFFAGRQLNRSLNPEEAVVSGAAVQAAILVEDKSQVTRSLLALDIASLSLGIEAGIGKMHTLIKRCSAIPVVVTRTFTTFDDHQPDLVIRAYQGEGATTEENHLLGSFLLKGLCPVPRGMLLVEVTFYINADGILTVFAHDKASSNASPITVDAHKGRLSRDKLQKLAADHEKYQAEDRVQKWKLVTKNYLQSCAFSVKRTSEDILCYLTLQAKKKMVEKCQQALSWLSPARWLKKRRSGPMKMLSGPSVSGPKSLGSSTAGINRKRPNKFVVTTCSWTVQFTQTTTVIYP
ncbi:PREDICTED: heat shock 70 kDa protein 1A-like [Gavialis gangeticus]|uniref:heat shock 70 kDa protein 1A-like n=1 Tax=Gavialis gangeticus TaxID=94835 RepID=UPI00092F649E|nr:PREDICTED: heat shock 70 kDa protein 1A-like [Gavialis gangeticus]